MNMIFMGSENHKESGYDIDLNLLTLLYWLRVHILREVS